MMIKPGMRHLPNPAALTLFFFWCFPIFLPLYFLYFTFSYYAMSLSWGGAFLIDTDESLDQGDKIILPSTALQQLLAKAPGGELPSPLTFCLRHPHRSDIMIHGGVKEFSGLDNRISLPLWMMDALGLKQDERVVIAYKQLPKGTWARLRSLTPNDAPRIQNYRATLEAHLRQHYNTLTAGQTLTCRYGAMEYPFLVVDLQPAPAVCVTDTDLEVDLEDIMVDQAQTGSSSHASSGQASSMIPISLNSTKQSTVEKDTYRYFELTGLSPGITKLSMSVTVSTGDLDVVIGYGRLPTLEQNDLLDISSDKDRQLQVDLTTLDETKRSLTIGIHGFVDSNYTLTIDVENKGSAEVSSNNTPAPEDTVNKQQCQNCHASSSAT
ncbi:UFD1-domain-containing protein [Hesseltinella vesiculosa]|uniref:UFD1-domain-containing protein n=1 Tax=Hesseltinella vesiculosa TaxID=101127 RepID=A0A1X2GFH2_9FUNG|nr:UFD1-domain-containing protein [Hesseltinella vesiculosa]